jgi:hypothetical protein
VIFFHHFFIIIIHLCFFFIFRYLAGHDVAWERLNVTDDLRRKLEVAISSLQAKSTWGGVDVAVRVRPPPPPPPPPRACFNPDLFFKKSFVFSMSGFIFCFFFCFSQYNIMKYFFYLLFVHNYLAARLLCASAPWWFFFNQFFDNFRTCLASVFRVHLVQAKAVPQASEGDVKFTLARWRRTHGVLFSH